MAVNVNAIEGHINANSYCSIQEATEYLQSRLDYDIWNSLEDDDKARYLITATDMVDSLPLNPYYYSEDPNQSLKYPLYGETRTITKYPLENLIFLNNETLSEVNKSVSLLTGEAQASVYRGGYYDESNTSNVVLGSGWTSAGSNYTHSTGEASSLRINIEPATIVDNDVIEFNLSVSGITAGSIDVKVGTLSPYNRIIDSNGDYVFTLVTGNVDAIFINATGDFDGSVNINSIFQTEEKYQKFLVIKDDSEGENSFNEGEKYKLNITNIVGGSIILIEGENVIETITPEMLPYSIERVLTANELSFYNVGFADLTIYFNMEHINHAPSWLAAERSVILQAIHLVENRDLIEQSIEGEITRYTKEGYGHGSNEKSIVNMNPYKKYAPGVIALMRPYIKLWNRVGRI